MDDLSCKLLKLEKDIKHSKIKYLNLDISYTLRDFYNKQIDRYQKSLSIIISNLRINKSLNYLVRHINNNKETHLYYLNKNISLNLRMLGSQIHRKYTGNILYKFSILHKIIYYKKDMVYSRIKNRIIQRERKERECKKIERIFHDMIYKIIFKNIHHIEMKNNMIKYGVMKVDVIKENVMKDDKEVTENVEEDRNYKMKDDKKECKGDNNIEEDKNITEENKSKIEEMENIKTEDKNITGENKSKLEKENKNIKTEDKSKPEKENKNITEENKNITEENKNITEEDKNITEEDKSKLEKDMENIKTEDRLVEVHQNYLNIIFRSVEMSTDLIRVSSKTTSINTINLFSNDSSDILNFHILINNSFSRLHNSMIMRLINSSKDSYTDSVKLKILLTLKNVDYFIKGVSLYKRRNNLQTSDRLSFILQKGSLENDRRFLMMIDDTLSDIEKYKDPVVVRMGIQFILAKKYVEDIIYLKE